MLKYKILIFLFVLSNMLFAQEEISTGKKYSMYSRTLDEERTYWVYLPPNYENNAYGKASYPVIYLLDGDKNFLLTVGLHQSYTGGMYNNMPECIIVGIPNTDRTRDLTPSQSSLIREGKEMYANSGGCERFTVFLTQELRRKIDADYRTNGYNLLIGHSLGGLFAINTLLHHTEAFNAYMSLDPSLWWDNRKVFTEAKGLWKTKDFKGRSLYVAMAKEEDKASDIEHSATIKEFCTTLLSCKDNNLNSSWKYYEGDNHGTVLISGISDGFKKIFEGIGLPVKQIPRNPELIEKHYKALSEKLGFIFIPDETLIDNIGKYALSIDNIEGAVKIFEYNRRNYPDSENTKASLLKAKEKRNINR
jgi:predicted alpha/beta superfamily hydrolase